MAESRFSFFPLSDQEMDHGSRLDALLWTSIPGPTFITHGHFGRRRMWNAALMTRHALRISVQRDSTAGEIADVLRSSG
jgi:hypothetical protein